MENLQTNQKKGVVRLIGTSSKYHIAPVFIAPHFDSITNEFIVGKQKFKGKRSGDAEDAPIISEGAPIRLTDTDSYRIAHLQVFDLDNPVDAFLLEIAKNSGFVAERKSDVNPGEHRYYVENKEDDAVETISKSEKIFDAMTKIKSMALDELIDFSRILGIYAPALSQKQIQAGLLKICNEKPNEIILAFEDKNRKHRIFLKKLVSARILSIKNGKYMYETEMVGANEDFAIEYMKDPNNNAIVTQWNRMLKSSSEKSIVDAAENTPVEN